MSQWNNSYSYNNPYQGNNSYNGGDMNGQYGNQAYYQEPGTQYVSFDQFLTQMQNNTVRAPDTGNNSNPQYQNYPETYYDYQGMPSSSQDTQSTYNYVPNTPSEPNLDSQSNASNKKGPTNDVVLKSNLTATATEFVPKSSNAKASTSNHMDPESSNTNHTVKSSKNGSSSDRNWRERPSSSQKSNSRHDFFRNESNNYRNQDSRDNNHPQSTYRNQDYYDCNIESNGRSLDSGSYNEGANSRESGRYEKGQAKNRTKNKDAERTFYNSSANKSGVEGRSGRGSKNWIGTQRVRAIDRSEDERYANNYLQYKDDKGSTTKDIASPRKEVHKEKVAEEKFVVSKETNQRERLSQQLDKGTLECLVCCERVKQMDPVWSCSNCYHVLHLRCIRKWATSSILEGRWRCPACQNTSDTVPTEYRCMCGDQRSPEYRRGASGAHTCGRKCSRARTCDHPCPLTCHPGPCPPCQTVLTKKCGCGAQDKVILCSSKAPLECGAQCNRTLACGAHSCPKLCHEGPCDACTETVTQECYCISPKPRTVPCAVHTISASSYSCGAPCGRAGACGAHACVRACHPPPCPPCLRSPYTVLTCPCGRTKLEPDSRQRCTDPIPLCDNICARALPCGPPNDKHFCKLSCHEGDCPPCPDTTVLPCRCGHTSKEVPCSQLPEMYNNVFCQKKCNKKLSCGRHRCRSTCCADTAHRCAAPCGRALSCQLHRCEEFCHMGHCAPCSRLGFSELSCSCGAQVLYPPVRCGARPPACSQPCGRTRACGHPPHHTCHTGDCPPCVVLTAKTCYGKHEERKTIPCSQEEFSCGLPCGKPLPCGKHTCIKVCHKGPCDTSKCTQPCTVVRQSCGHPCAAPCHAGVSEGGEGGSASVVCPSSAPCRRTVTAVCPCSRRTQERLCHENQRDLARIMSALAATKLQEGGSVDLSDVQKPSSMLKTLECDDECRVEARSRQMALALQIRNPDVSAKLAPRYGDNVRATAAREPHFAQQIHDRLTELVHLAKKSKQKTRSYSFPSMNWQKRQFIHELCEHFGCESMAYDAEPNRNVVATADKEKSWLPAMSVLEVLGREAGKRRVPPPVLRAASNALNNKSGSGWATLTPSNNAWAARSQARAKPDPAPAVDKIDYFDNPPDY